MGNLTLKELGRRAFETAKAKGFHDEPIDIPRALMLTVSELAEALEADRKNKRADLSAFFDKEPCEIFPFREKFEVHVKDTFRTSWPTRPFACLIYPPHSASISKCTFC